jgi:hypothetical protein
MDVHQMCANDHLDWESEFKLKRPEFECLMNVQESLLFEGIPIGTLHCIKE